MCECNTAVQHNTMRYNNIDMEISTSVTAVVSNVELYYIRRIL